jgi:hypothetical protein
VAVRVKTDNISSARMTVLDVRAPDRPGLLYAIAEALHGAGASIELARIATEGNRATDAFYVVDAYSRGKFVDPERIGEIESAVRRRSRRCRARLAEPSLFRMCERQIPARLTGGTRSSVSPAVPNGCPVAALRTGT